jgi:hypothetical protein
MSRQVALVVFLALSQCDVLASQVQGARVGQRVRAICDPVCRTVVQGGFLRAEHDTVYLVRTGRDTARVPTRWIQRLEVDTGRRNAGPGARIGLLLGAGVGIVAGLGFSENCGQDNADDAIGCTILGSALGGPPGFALIGAILFAPLGAATGAIIGSLGTGWQEVQVTRPEDSAMP